MRKARYRKYVAIGWMIAGSMVAAWNGYAYWEGYRAVQPTATEPKPISKPVISSVETKTGQPEPKLDEHMGTLFIPKLHISIPIYHGATEQQLRKGVGHYPKSALPGEEGNVVLSGHRDTVFRRLGSVGKNDELIVQTKAGEFIYRVKKVRIVSENDRTVLVEKPRPTLTVTTCYPFDFIGNAKQRYVLVADFISPSASRKEQQKKG
ncbi:class D sortase [Anoxybacillus rupiensis]|uniref:Class D sortase n=1 Tax=Anoxybacteroides rupiense TaxID=311460 RepID=A0ABT5W641_9BACL|nr:MULTISPECIES: class D sortase [Anoxybacillus]MDE8564795.1 class D sortase [Anoxybacillus rupiensis]